MSNEIFNMICSTAQSNGFEALAYCAPDIGNACIYLSKENNIFRIKAPTTYEIDTLLIKLLENNLTVKTIHTISTTDVICEVIVNNS